MIEAIAKRRSIREYLDETVSEDALHDILLSAFYAPSANGLYPWELVIIEQTETKDWLSKVTPWSGPAKTASAVIAVIGREQDSPQWIEDASIAAEHLWLAATDHGLGVCWLQIRGNNNAEKEIKEKLNVPEGCRVLCLLTIGKPTKTEAAHEESAFDKSKIKYERY